MCLVANFRHRIAVRVVGLRQWSQGSEDSMVAIASRDKGSPFWTWAGFSKWTPSSRRFLAAEWVSHLIMGLACMLRTPKGAPFRGPGRGGDRVWQREFPARRKFRKNDQWMAGVVPVSLAGSDQEWRNPFALCSMSSVWKAWVSGWSGFVRETFSRLPWRFGLCRHHPRTPARRFGPWPPNSEPPVGSFMWAALSRATSAPPTSPW